MKEKKTVPNLSAPKIVWQYDLTNLTQQEIIIIQRAIAVNILVLKNNKAN